MSTLGKMCCAANSVSRLTYSAIRLFAFLAFAATSPAWAGNILINPSFESGSLGPWYNDFGTAVEPWNVTNSAAHTGSFSATNVGNSSIRQDFTAVAAASITEVSLWVSQPEAGIGGLFAIFSVEFYYSDASSSQHTGFSPTPGFAFHDFTSDLDLSKELTGIAIFGYVGGPDGAEDRTFIDDVVIDGPAAAVPEPSSFILLSAGVTAFALFRKKSGRDERG